jgi:hypothetical protein
VYIYIDIRVTEIEIGIEIVGGFGMSGVVLVPYALLVLYYEIQYVRKFSGLILSGAYCGGKLESIENVKTHGFEKASNIIIIEIKETTRKSPSAFFWPVIEGVN